MLLYADVMVMSERAEQLESLLDGVSVCGRDLGVSVSNESSKVMLVKRQEEERNSTCTPGGNELQQAREYKYLGIWMDVKRQRMKRLA